MTPLAHTATTLAKTLQADSAFDRTGNHGAQPAAFAGLLDAQQQRLATQRGSSTAYNGSAFDMAPAQRAPARPAASSNTPPNTPAREAQLAPKPAAERAPQRSTLTPPAAQSNAPAQPAKPSEAAEADRDDGAARSADAAPQDGAAADAPAAAAGPGEAAEGEHLDAKPSDAQSLLDWMARFATPPAAGAAAASVPRGLPGAAGDASGVAGSPVTGATSSGADAAGAHALLEAAESRAALAVVGEAGGGAAHALSTEAAAALKTGESAIAPLPGLQAPAAAQQAAGATAPLAVAVPTPVDSPDFSQALASQLTTFARDGVHEAQLQLNPVDMGPISVQITLDGSQAQIDFSAQHARTREALEAAWPALAASLHGAGMTLGGGGVFEQRSGPRDGEAGGGTGRSAVAGADADDATGTSSRTVRIDTQRGLLDLYA